MALAAPAFAATPSAADVESARALYVRGKQLRDEGDLAGSLESLKAAHALVPTPITALELARALSLLTRLLEARAILLTIERMPILPDESKKAGASREEARALSSELGELIPSLAIKVDVAPGIVPVVTIDAQQVPTEALAVPRKVDPGKHVVHVRAGTMEKTEEVTVSERESRSLTFDLRGAAPVTTPPASDQGARGATTEATTNPWLVASLATAGVATVVGTVSGAVAWSTSTGLHDACLGGRCPPEAHDDLSLVQTTSTISTVAFIAAGASLAAAVAIWAFSPARGRNVMATTSTTSLGGWSCR
jgi:hypothetical protein